MVFIAPDWAHEGERMYTEAEPDQVQAFVTLQLVA